ncbi:MAG TPA: hypothetical protein VFB42_06335 [Gaiellaceae bacterium]|nr:hypothetical protein [Gaiellaceae bacterium]
MHYLRVYADADGESHFAEVELPTERVAEPARALVAELSAPLDAGVVVFRNVLSEPTDGYPHVAPRRQLIVQLGGEAEIETSDGEVRRLSPGSVVLVEDTTGKGHVTRGLSPGGRTTLVVTLPDGR